MNEPNAMDLETIFQSGREHLDEGHAEAALEQFDQLTHLDPEAPVGHFFKGVALTTMERHEEAAASFLAAHKLAPGSLPILHHFAISCLQTDRWMSALHALTHYFDVSGTSDKSEQCDQSQIPPQIHLLLGFAAAQACEVTLGLTVSEYLQWDSQNHQGEHYHVDLQDPLTLSLMALSAAAQGSFDAAQETLDALRKKNEVVAREVESAFPKLAAWRSEHAVAETGEADRETPSQSAARANFDWEAENEALKSHLARFAHFQQSGQEPPREAFEELLHALKAAYLLVPTDGEIENVADEDGETRLSFAVMLRPHEAFGNRLVAVAFTGVAEARDFFEEGVAIHRVVIVGEDLAGMMVTMATSLDSRGPDEITITDEDNSPLAALLVNPAGPHPYAFPFRDLLILTH